MSASSDSRPDVVAQTSRLLVRPWRIEEAPRLLDILSRSEVTRWLGDSESVPMRDLDDARRRIEKYHLRSGQPPLGYWAVEVRTTGEVAGSVMLLEVPNAEHGEVQVGWYLHPDACGNGYASEAAAAVLSYGFDCGLPAILALTHVENDASQAVARRIGMEHLGTVEKWYDGPSAAYRALPGTGRPPRRFGVGSGVSPATSLMR